MEKKKSNFNLNELLSRRSLSDTGEKEKTEVEAEEIIMIDVEDLEPSRENFYRVDSGLKTSIAIAGIMEPLTVEKQENGRYKIISGHRRHLAVKELLQEGNTDIRKIPCVYKKAEIKDRLAVILANGFRKKTDFEKMMETVIYEEEAAEIKKEFKIKGKTREILAELTGLSEGQIGRYKAVYNNLVPEWMEVFKEDKVVFSVIVEISGFSREEQGRLYKQYKDNQYMDFSLAEIKSIKEEGKKEETGQTEKSKDIVSEEGEGDGKREDATQEEAEQRPKPGQREAEEQQEFNPQPETVTSLCFSCLHYAECHEKKSTVKDCNNYINKAEAEKTPEQKYKEEQEKIDRDTKKKIREIKQEEKMQNTLAGDKKPARREHETRLSCLSYDDIKMCRQTFLLLQNKDNYQAGDKLILKEYKAGSQTGREIQANIAYVLEEHRGLTEGFCVLGIQIEGEKSVF